MESSVVSFMRALAISIDVATGLVIAIAGCSRAGRRIASPAQRSRYS
jgi:hypothetical protein